METDAPPAPDDGAPGPVAAALNDAPAVDPLEEEAMLAAVSARMFGDRQPIRVGRYELGEALGHGAAGDVYLARDPKLAREVAIKLLRPIPGEHGERARQRFLREARSIARLTHPNVVEVFDAGDFSWSSLPGEIDDEHGVYIVMERVRGRDLERWLAETDPGPARILERFLLAGEGLAAAHREGIVHRDFKPSNVLVSEAGAVKVADFGLALVRGVDASSDMSTHHERHESSATDGRLTEPGTLLGTPLFMAPEQHRGRTAEPRSDQFAFCASLWRALVGRPPFVGDDPAALRDAKRAGPPPRPPELSRALHRILARGLRPDPAARWPSMDALLRALRPRPVRPRPLLLLGLATAAIAGAALLLPSRASDRRCDPTPRIEAVWSDARRDALHHALEASSLPYAAHTRERLQARVQTHVQAWGEHYRHTCEDPEATAQIRDLRMLCLLRQLEQLDALLQVIGEGDPAVLERALGAASALPDPSRCDDHGYVDAVVGPPPVRALAEPVEQLREGLVQLETLERLGRYEPAVVQARGLVAEAERLGHPPVLAHALLRRGSLEEHAGDFEAAATTLERAFFVAQSIPDPARAAEIASLQVYLHGHRLRSFDAAQTWARHARAALDQRPDPDMEADLLDNLAALDIDQRRYESALERYRQAHALRRDHADPLVLARASNNIATALDYLGQHEDALAEYEQALRLRREQLGPEHPDVATVLYNMANSSMKLGDADRALALHEQALAIRERSLGPHHVRTGHSVNNIATVHLSRGDLEQAQPMLERALEIWQEALGEDHPYVAGTTNNLAYLYRQRGDTAAARQAYERALTLARNAHGPDHPQVLIVLAGLAAVLDDLGEYERAIERYEQGLALHEREPGPDETAGDLLLGLSMTLVHADRDPARARALAERAITHYEAAGPRGTERLAQARDWLAELP